MTVNKNELDKLIAKAGIGDRTAAKLRKANEETPVNDGNTQAKAASTQAKGHGAPSANTTPMSTF